MLVTGLLVCAVPTEAEAAPPQTSLEQWLLRRLNAPTDREREHERKGHVYIYDGLTDREVDQALDRHFDRIQYMMFLGTLRTDPAGEIRRQENGNVETETPGCGP
jgi:hypothetical protein